LKHPTINLYLPGLWTLLRHGGSEALAEMPSLQLLLKRCDSLVEYEHESETHLLNSLGWQPDEECDPPIAALEWLAEGLATEGDTYWFRADPVHLTEDQNYLMMSYPAELDLDLQAAKILADSINRHFVEDGWELKVADSKRWYLRLDKHAGIRTTAAWRVVGRDVFNLMPAGVNSKQWHSWLMELQMLLFSHPVNEERNKQGQAAVSGLWLWGGGNLPVLSPTSRYLLRGNTLFMQGVGRQSGCETKDLPEDMSSVLNDIALNCEQLIMLEHARSALQSGDLHQGISSLKQLEKEVFRPMLLLLKSRNLKRLIVIDTPGFILDTSAGGMKKWWRRRKQIPG